MLKYVDVAVTFSEVPDEIALCIDISNCPCHCEGCHSAYLAKDIGTELTQRALEQFIRENNGVSCVCLMGGDSEPEIVNLLGDVIHMRGKKSAWYSGRQELSDKIDLKNFDYIKLGPYIPSKGGLDNPNTNQKFYEVCRLPSKFMLKDITNKFWKNVQ